MLTSLTSLTPLTPLTSHAPPGDLAHLPNPNPNAPPGDLAHLPSPSPLLPSSHRLSAVPAPQHTWPPLLRARAPQGHYPFENKEKFESSFPADFIAEGIDQTRGWFYTLMVLSTALFDKPAFKNLICNGLVLAEDGRKMSKRLKNYPDPQHILATYGADALRLYLINSPVVRAEDLRFAEDGVKQVVRDVFIPWYHAYRLFVQSANALEGTCGKPFDRDAQCALASTNTMDRWILASAHSLLRFMRQEMELYRCCCPIGACLIAIDCD